MGLFDSFGAWFDSYDEFKKFLMSNTGDYKFVFYIANSSSDVRSEVYKVIKCPQNVPSVQYEF